MRRVFTCLPLFAVAILCLFAGRAWNVRADEPCPNTKPKEGPCPGYTATQEQVCFKGCSN